MKKAIVTYGRFNPPTKGHELIVNTMLNHADYEPILFTSVKGNTVVNPLELSTKAKILNTAFPLVRTVISHKITDVFKMLLWLKDNNYTDIILVCGSDKYKRYNELLEDYKSTTNFTNTRTIGLDRTVDSVSATELRAKIRENNEFSYLLPSNLRNNTKWKAVIYKETQKTAVSQ